MGIKQNAIDEVLARAVAWFTTSNVQNIPRPLVAAMKKLPGANYIRNRYNVETFEVKSFDGLKLAGTVFHSVKGCNWDGKNHVILMVHGFQVQQAMMWAELPFFLPHGYDCVTIDLRTAGLSEGKNINTMGYNEAKDLAATCKYIREKYGDDVVLGLYGQSMGSATIMQYCSDDPNLGFMIEDCGYASLKDTIHEIQSRLLKFVDFEDFYPRVLKYATVGDITYEDVVPIESVKKLDPEVPTMFLHSTGDTYIAPGNAKQLYDARPGTKKELHYYSIAPHSGSFMMHPIQYKKDIDAFLKKYDLVK